MLFSFIHPSFCIPMLYIIKGFKKGNRQQRRHHRARQTGYLVTIPKDSTDEEATNSVQGLGGEFMEEQLLELIFGRFVTVPRQNRSSIRKHTESEGVEGILETVHHPAGWHPRPT